ncbi:uncharacterized protein LOC131889161 [Tigriopus californicus]|uniref:uncharacterized protein LOC131889161 n=1 Tax=Tigriopus californicus TaxID=6832 RepID=UPI0027D9F9C0|nr:uncharacterized protein LOC131889161 [Tigriopus californicus]
MQSIFWPSIRIGEKYDIKGCLLGRYEPNISADDDVVQKDGNFHGTPLNFGQYQSWLLEQINRDVEFLRSHGIVDYSLLVGIQRSLNWKSFHLQRLSVAEVVTSFKRSSIGFANDAAHEIRSASARKRKQTIQNGRTLAADSSHTVEESGSKTSPPRPASKVSAPLERRHSTSSFLSELINDTKETDFVTANRLTATAATAPQQIILKPLKPKKVKHMKVRQVTFSRSVSESRYTPPASTSPTPSLHFQIHSQASPSPLSSPSHRTAEISTKKPSEESGNTSFHSPGISPLVEQINQQLSFSPDPKTDDWEANPDLIEYAPRTVDGQTADESIIYDWHKLDDFMAIEHRRLLPDTPNAVHILDGPGNRYYLGIVDIFTPYGFRQRLGGLGKTLLLCGSNHSSAGPDKYAKRLLNFLEDHLC